MSTSSLSSFSCIPSVAWDISHFHNLNAKIKSDCSRTKHSVIPGAGSVVVVGLGVVEGVVDGVVEGVVDEVTGGEAPPAYGGQVERSGIC